MVSPTALPTFIVEPSAAPVEPTEAVEVGTSPSPVPEATAASTCTGIFKQELTFYPIPSDLIPGDQSSCVGIQYGNEAQYFKIRVYGNCNIIVTTSEGFYEEQIARNERNTFKDAISDLLFVRWDGSGTLQVGQNDFEQPYRFNIGTSLPATGQIQLVTESTRV